MNRWFPIMAILAAGIIGAIWLSQPDAPVRPATGHIPSRNALSRMRISAGGSHALAIASDGSLWSWGDTMHGPALGLGKITVPVPRPTRVGRENSWAEISAGFDYSMAIKRDGSLWAWGGNPAGILGDGTTQTRETPTRVGTANDWQMVGTGLHHSLGLKRDGTIWAWGANNVGALGVPYQPSGTNQSFVPLQVGMDTDWKAIAVGALQNAALKTDGSLWMWGDSGFGLAGAANSPSNHYTPVQIGADTNWVALAAGYYHMLALRSDGTLWHWGRNSHLLGGIPAKDPSQIRQLGKNADWVAIYDGGYHNLARKTNGSLWQFGKAGFGSSGAPTQVQGDWVAADGGAEFTVGLARDGSLWSWGALIGVKKNPGWLKEVCGELLQKLGVPNQLRQAKTPTRQKPERIFQLSTEP